MAGRDSRTNFPFVRIVSQVSSGCGERSGERRGSECPRDARGSIVVQGKEGKSEMGREDGREEE